MKKLLFSFSAIFALLPVALGQDWVQKMQDPNGNYYEAKSAFDAYWATHDKTQKGKGHKAFMRWANFVEPRVYPSGNLSLLSQSAANYEAFLKEYQKQNAGPGKNLGSNNNLIASATWTPIGPMGAISGNAGGQFLKAGRLNFITITPGSPSVLWVGAPAGGLWKSTNNGASWTTNTDQLGVIGCSDLAIDPTNTLVMYLATGDGDAGDTRSIGVLKSTNGGATWAATGLTNAVTTNFTIRRLLVNPSNTQIVLAATSSGIYRTTNGGTNWSQITTNSTFDLEFKPGDPNTVYAAGTSFRLSTNGGASFTTISNGISTTGVNRMAIAVTPNDVNYVYVLASDNVGSGFEGFYRSTNSGVAFTQMANTPNLLGWSSTGSDTDGQGWYDLCVAASPLDKNEVIVGGVNVWKTSNGGTSWSLFGHWVGSGAPFTHADQHDLEYDASGTLYATNDGAVYRRTATAWTDISGTMNIAQIYRIGLSSLSANLWITGHQDNGTSTWNGTTYQARLGGDGMDCFIDRTNNQNMFGEYQYGDFQRSTNGGSSWSNITSGITGNPPWLTVWKQDPVSSTRLYCGIQDMFVSNNLGTSWTQLATMPASTSDIKEFAIAPSNNQVIYVLKTGGVYKTINGGTSWTNVTGTIPVGSAQPEYVCVDPTDANNAWVVLSGYSSGNKVFVTTNGGTSWTNISANLPNLPANCIVYQPGTNDLVYVGMDVGIYYRSSTMTSWTLYNLSLPNVPISELEITPANPLFLYASTYGRGVWVASVVSAAAPPSSSYSVVSAGVCKSQPTQFGDLSTNTPTAWLWSVSPAAGVVISSPGSQNPSITFPNSGSYTVSLQASNSFGSGNTYTQAITVSATPTISVSAPSATVCQGSPATFTASGATSYVWSNGGGSSPIGVFNPVVNSVYTVTGTTGGCTSTRTVSAIVQLAPIVQITGSNTACAGSPVVLQAAGALSYTWSNAQSGSSTTVTPQSSTTFSVSGTAGNGCKGSASWPITVFPLPQILVSSNDSVVCADDQITLDAQGASTYTWQPGSFSGNQFVTTAGSVGQFTCTGTDGSGCENAGVITLTVELCASIKDQQQTQKLFDVFPNPVKNKLIVRAHQKTSGDVTVEIRDVVGKVVLKQSVAFGSSATAELNLSALPGGTYFVLLKTDGHRVQAEPVKIIKE